MKYTLSFFFTLLFSTLIAQVESNEFFKVLHASKTRSHAIQNVDSNLFLINSNEGNAKAFLIDGEGAKQELPCDRLNITRCRDESKVYSCAQDSMSCIYSVYRQATLSPFYKSVVPIGENFYAVKQDEFSQLYNMNHELISEVVDRRELSSIYQICDENHITRYTDEGQVIINLKGEIVTDHLCYNWKKEFSNGTFTFLQDGKQGLKDSKQNVIIPPKYNLIEEWIEGKYIVGIEREVENSYTSKKTFKGIVDLEDQILLPLEHEILTPFSFGLASRKPGCKNAFIDNSLTNIYGKEFDKLRVSKNGLIQVTYEGKDYFDLGHSTTFGTLKEGLESAKSLTEKFSKVKYNSGDYHLIDQSGKVIFKGDAQSVSYTKLTEEIIVVSQDGNVGLLNSSGQWIQEPGNYSFKKFSKLDGIFRNNKDYGTTDLINSSGDLIIANAKNGGIIPSTNNYILERSNLKGVVNPSGDIIVPFEFQRIHEYPDASNFFLLTLDGMTYLVKTTE